MINQILKPIDAYEEFLKYKHLFDFSEYQY